MGCRIHFLMNALAQSIQEEWNGEHGVIKKDQLERRMQVLVCAGRLSLDAARSTIYFDWRGAFNAALLRTAVAHRNARRGGARDVVVDDGPSRLRMNALGETHGVRRCGIPNR